MQPITIENGFALLAGRPGHGCEIDWRKASSYEFRGGDVFGHGGGDDARAAE